jgi:hypothetical protein
MGIARRQRRQKMSRKESEGRYRQMMRTQLLNVACQSLTAAEVQSAIEKGVNHSLSYVSTKLDENGVPVDGETKQIKLSNIDLRRLEMIKRNKESNESFMKENAKVEA